MSTNDTLRGQLLKQADEIAKAGHNGWGNTMREAAAALAEPVSGGVQLAASREGRVYLAGPMTGYAGYNFPAFNAEAARLRDQGLHVENPAEHGIVEGAEWGDYLRYDIGRLATVERIHLLPGWSKSNGAKLEVSIAKALGMHVWYADGAEHVDDVAALNGGAVAEPVSAPVAQPDVSGLVAALEWYADCGKAGDLARTALTDFRAKQGGGV